MVVAATKAKVPAKPTEHPMYSDMVKSALIALKERIGSSRQAIEKYIKTNYKVGGNCNSHLKLALKRMLVKGTILQAKGRGATGSYKLNKAIKEEKPKKKVAKPAAKKPTKKPAVKNTVKKPTEKKAKSPTKTPKKAGEANKNEKLVAKPKPTQKVAKKPAKKTTKPAAKKAAKSPKK